MKIKEICTIYNGGTPSTLEKSYWDGEIKWITPKDLSLQKSRYIYQGERNISELGLKNSSAKLLPINTVLLTSRAPIGYLSMSKDELATNQGFKSLVCGESVLPLYLYYYLSTKVEELISISSGSTFLELSTKVLGNFDILLPPLEMQQHIVDTIGSIDDLIEKTTDLISKLKKFGEAIFLKNDNRDTLARNVISFVRGIEVGSKNYLSKKEKETTPFYRVGNMVSRNIDTFVLNNDAYPKLNYNDISLSFDGAVGRVGIGLEGFYSSGIRKVTSLTNKYSNGYLYFWVLSEKTQNIISEHAVGTTILHASSSIDYLSIDSNPNKNTREISDLLFSEIIKRLKLIDYLSVLKQELLEKYF